ncbi:MAG TPA: hypothetical protein ENK39_07720 [Epsilonproteobacteria bacterium]|nr:hypothetical protein [Campylobacterota bacterium]
MQKNIVKEVSSFLTATTLLMLVFLMLQGCEDKKQKTKPIPIENTTEIFTEKDKKIHSKKQKSNKIQTNIQKTLSQKESAIDHSLSSTYTLKEGKRTYTATLLNKKLQLQDISQPIILMTLSKSTCKPCLSQIKSLDKVSKKYQKDVIVIHLFEAMQDTKFIHAIHDIINVHPDTATPLTLLFKKGEVYSHFEGPTPIEMILYDIQQARKQ